MSEEGFFFLKKLNGELPVGVGVFVVVDKVNRNIKYKVECQGRCQTFRAWPIVTERSTELVCE